MPAPAGTLEESGDFILRRAAGHSSGGAAASQHHRHRSQPGWVLSITCILQLTDRFATPSPLLQQVLGTELEACPDEASCAPAAGLPMQHMPHQSVNAA